jgi:hypothetical protein
LDFYWGGTNRENGITIVMHHRQWMPLPEGVYDLVAVKRMVSMMDRKRTFGHDYDDASYYGWHYEPSFESAFYRAVRSLGERGWLVQQFFTVEDNNSRQRRRLGQRIRFVSCPMCSLTLLNT